MRLSALLVMLLVLGTGLAGCLGEDEAPEPAVSDEQGGVVFEEGAIDDGTREANESLGAMDHMHDYWKGAERVTIMDEAVTVDPFTGLAFTFFNVYEGTPGVGGAFLQLPDGSIVFEGTGQLEFTVSWSEATITGMGVRYRSAASEDFSEEMPLQQGEPLVVEVTPAMTDMPHAKTSRWMFLLTPSQAGQAMVGTFNVKVDVIKTRDPTLFPGHPDLFGDASTLELFRGQGQSSQSSGPMTVVGFATRQPQADDSVQSARVVPMETLSMTGNLSILSASASTGDVAEVWLEYKPADSFRFYRAQLLASDAEAGTYQFGWPVEMAQTDSPYASESAWHFRVRATTDPSGGALETQMRGISDVQVEFELVVVAYDALLEGIGPLEQRDRD